MYMNFDLIDCKFEFVSGKTNFIDMEGTGKTAPAGQSNLYGRFVRGTTGKLTIDGVAIN